MEEPLQLLAPVAEVRARVTPTVALPPDTSIDRPIRHATGTPGALMKRSSPLCQSVGWRLSLVVRP
jgi:hypothetical protein